MKTKTVYLVLSLVGAVLPYWQFLPWVAHNGMNLSLFFDQLFANRISAFFALDVMVSAVVLVVFIFQESRARSLSGRWLPLLAVATVGVSLALPLFLYLRERKLDHQRATAVAG